MVTASDGVVTGGLGSSVWCGDRRAGEWCVECGVVWCGVSDRRVGSVAYGMYGVECSMVCGGYCVESGVVCLFCVFNNSETNYSPLNAVA